MEVERRQLEVEVVYALPQRQVVLSLAVPHGTRVREALERSGIRSWFPELDFERLKVGIFGRVVSPDAILKHGDRIEIYRPLTADPKTTRQRRAGKGG
jgi:putative ubiquitin-RnfH superfamily antitoxin RatB of RatAB toxin-antitoxin module